MRQIIHSAAATIVLLACAIAAAGVNFHIKIDPVAKTGPGTGRLSGRLVVYVHPTTEQAGVGEALFGVDVADFKAGDTATIDDGATCYPVKPSELSPGDYTAQAVLDVHHDDSNWRREAGNLYSSDVKFAVASSPQTVEISLSNVIPQHRYPTTQGAEILEARSKLLSEFHHRDMLQRAVVVFPKSFDPNRKYPAVYHIPGFGGDGLNFIEHPENWFDKNEDGDLLSRNAFQIWLDPESGNGHTLFANSDNNGPRGDALVSELIPALEAKYPLISKADARIVIGHSSGGWASLWLTLQYPQTFGACFATSPDPVDFHRLEEIDIYDQDNMYRDGDRIFYGARPKGSKPVQDENLIEEVIGPHNTSAQDWDSWQADWGRRDAEGHVANLFDPFTGKIDHAEAESYRRFDITDLLRTHPDRYAPIFRERVRLIVGDKDTFFLNEAVALLKQEFDSIPNPSPAGQVGYIRILPGYDHGTILRSPDEKTWPKEMVEHLRSSGYIQ